MKKIVILGLIIGCVCVAGDRFTDFYAHHGTYTYYDVVGVQPSTLFPFRVMCIASGKDTACSATGTWEKKRYFVLPTTIETSYSGSVTTYYVCQDTTGTSFSRFSTGALCGPGWVSPPLPVRLITNTTGWPYDFAQGGTTFYRADYVVYGDGSNYDVVIPRGDLQVQLPYYFAKKFTFSTYWTT